MGLLKTHRLLLLVPPRSTELRKRSISTIYRLSAQRARRKFLVLDGRVTRLYTALNGNAMPSMNDNHTDSQIEREVEVESMEEESRRLLEWENVCRQVSCFASSPLAVQKILINGLPLPSSLEETNQLIAETTEALKFDLDFEGILDISPGLELLEENPRLVFTAFQLAGFASTIENALRLAEALKSNALLSNIMKPVSLVDPSSLTEIKISIRPVDGFILDEASEDLKRARQDREATQKELKTELDSWAKKLFKQGACERPIVVFRRDRLCIPVRNGRQGMLPKGSVRLSQSSSGSTVYMEPQPVVELNNKDALLHNQIRLHEQRVLTKLTQMILQQKEQLVKMVKALTKLDVIWARARYAKWIGGAKPRFLLTGTEEEFQVHIPSALHPLLLEQSQGATMPEPPSSMDVSFSEGFKPTTTQLINSVEKKKTGPKRSKPRPKYVNLTIPQSTTVVPLTGPNTGGKTASLKTLGLCVLMAKSGLYIPVANPADEVYLKWFDKFLADIGDSQSLQQSLSTFTGHVRRINKILNEVCGNSLVLLDEIGTGTDPTEGAALASSILCSLSEIAGLTVATTHHAEIKVLADQNSSFLNASMEFNANTLQPTYRLIWGSRGQSNALDICTALNFDSRVVEDAKLWLEKGVLQAEKETKLEDSLRQKLDETISQRAALEEAKREAQRRLDVVKEQLRLEKVKEQNLMGRLAKYDEVVAEADKEVDWILDEVKKDTLTFSEAESCLQELKDRGTKLASASAGAKLSWYPAYGETVCFRKMRGTYGKVISRDPGRMVQLQCGSMTFEVPIWDVEKVDPGDIAPQQKNVLQRTLSSESDADIKSNALRSSPIQNSYNTIDLRGLSVEDALDAFEADLNEKLGTEVFYIIHGKGTGALRSAVRDYLRTCKTVKSYEDDPSSDGGCTIVHLWV